MGAQGQAFDAFGVEFLHFFRPDHPAGAHFGNLHKEIHTGCPEKAQARGKIVNFNAGIDTGFGIF